MAERSQFWTTSTTGDGTASGYTEAQTIEWLRDILTPSSSAGPNTSQGVLRGVLGDLAVNAASGSVNVAAGAAVVEGFYYKNDATVNVAIPTPLANTRIDRIVLRASHGTTRTVRITRIAGTEGGAAPALTQTAGSTWDIPLAQISITTAGVISVTDQRQYCRFATQIIGAMLDASVVDNSTLELNSTALRVKDKGVTNAKLRDSTALSVIGNAYGTDGTPADIPALTNNTVLMRVGGALTFQKVDAAQIGNISAANIPDGLISNAKLRDSAGLSVVGRSTNSSGDVADITAASDGAVLRRSGSSLGFGQVVTAGLADNAVDDTKIGNRVPVLTRRTGGNGGNWSISGTDNFDVNRAQITVGSTLAALSLAANSTIDDVIISFAVTFASNPIVFATCNSNADINVAVRSVSTTGATLRIRNVGDVTATNVSIGWQAIGSR